MSKESPPVREVVPFKPGKRQSTFRKLNLEFAGTALEEALARREQQQEGDETPSPLVVATPLTPVTGVRGDTETLNPSADVSSSLTSETSVTHVTPVTSETPVTGVIGKKEKLSPATRDRRDAAPTRDFTRSANSIVRDAIPAGVFTGKGKHLYDYLYSQTRGAITPVRSARIPTEKVMAGAGMTRNTFRFHLERLCNSGLIRVEQRPGEHGGNVYTVMLPEEVGMRRGHRGERGEGGHPADTGENLPLVPGSEVDPSNQGTSHARSTAYGDPNTLFKTKEIRTDDEALAQFAAAMKQAAIDLTGKGLTPADANRWQEVADILITELKIAAGRTTVSSVPAFLAEHLRRRLWKKDKRQMEVEATEQKASAPARKVDASKCPDCFGAGMWYPEGFDKGVAKCAHSKLTEQDAK